MTWDIKHVQYWISRYFPGASAWDVIFSENDFGYDIDGNSRCRESFNGIAVDINGDQNADILLYSFRKTFAVDVQKLSPAIFDPWCFELKQESTVCNKELPPEVTPVAFPFSMELLPDTAGKIQSVMMERVPETEGLITQLTLERPDLGYHILYPFGEEAPAKNSINERGVEVTYSPLLESAPDWLTDAGSFWVQDRLLVGINIFGDSITVTWGENASNYAMPLMQTMGMQNLDAPMGIDGGDIVISLSHIFVHTHNEIEQNEVFSLIYGVQREIVEVNRSRVYSAAHLDMILTPTDDYRNGKPVVVIGEAVYLDKQNEQGNVLDEIAEDLEQKGFCVERIPFVFTDTSSESLFGSTPTAYSYNNILMEVYVEKGKLIKYVYLPQYGDPNDLLNPFQEYNLRAQDVFMNLGYTVIPIYELEPLAELGGALRCSVKVVKRGNFFGD